MFNVLIIIPSLQDCKRDISFSFICCCSAINSQGPDSRPVSCLMLLWLCTRRPVSEERVCVCFLEHAEKLNVCVHPQCLKFSSLRELYLHLFCAHPLLYILMCVYKFYCVLNNVLCSSCLLKDDTWFKDLCFTQELHRMSTHNAVRSEMATK